MSESAVPTVRVVNQRFCQRFNDRPSPDSAGEGTFPYWYVCSEEKAAVGVAVTLYVSPTLEWKTLTDHRGRAAFHLPPGVVGQELSSLRAAAVIFDANTRLTLDLTTFQEFRDIQAEAAADAAEESLEAAAEAKAAAEKEMARVAIEATREAEVESEYRAKMLETTRAFKPKMLAKRKVLYLAPSEYPPLPSCEVPRVPCSNYEEGDMPSNGDGPYDVVAETRTHWGLAAEEGPSSLADITMWIEKSDMVSASRYRALQRISRQQKLREQQKAAALERRLKKERVGRLVGYIKQIDMLLGYHFSSLDYRLKKFDHLGDSVRAFLLQSRGFGIPGGNKDYYSAVKELERGATFENLMDIVREAGRQFGHGNEGVLVLCDVMDVTIEQAETLIQIYGRAKQDGFAR